MTGLRLDPSALAPAADPSAPTRSRCTGTTPRGPCKQWPVRGATVCRSHGGAAPQVRAAAARREAEAQVRRGLARLDVAPIDDPLGELAKLAGQVVAWKDALAVKVNELTTGTCPECGPAEADAPLRYEAHGAGTEQLRAEVALFERALDRCASVLGLIAKLGIDERMARISELQAAAVVKAVDAGLAHLASQVPIPAEVAAETRGVVARHLRVVAS